MRQIQTETLIAAGQYYAALYMADAGVRNRAWVMKEFEKFTHKDEFEILIDAVNDELGNNPRAAFGNNVAKLLKDKPRSQKTFEKLLADKLAITPSGEHIEGKIGTVQVGGRRLGVREIEVEMPHSIKTRKAFKAAGLTPPPRQTYFRTAHLDWPIYAGEEEERAAGSSVPTPLPPRQFTAALNTRISNECAILACDAVVDNLDEGTGAAIIRGYTTAQAVDPDTAIGAQILCFTLVCSATAFGAAADDTGKATATAAAITDDSSADDTQTLAWCRASSTNDGATPLDDHIDGEAGTSAADWIFNTLAIVSGATVSASAWAVSMPES